MQRKGENVLDQSSYYPRILAVDDDQTLLRMVADKLDRAGFEVLTA
jgi:PleD family two-component response regulator